MLADAQIEQFRRAGYLMVPDVLTLQEVRQLNEAIDCMVVASATIMADDDMYNLEPGHRAECPRVRGLYDPFAIDRLFFDISRSAAVLDIVESLIGPNLRHDCAFVNLKPAQGGSPVQWHQDFALLPYTNDDVVVCGLALTDSTEQNGCLQVIPGSHLGPILDHHQDGVLIGAVQPDDHQFEPSHAVPFEVPAGGMSIHHCRLLHSSAPNRSATDRRIYFLDYAAADAYRIEERSDLSETDRRIVRGNPNRVARMMTLSFPVPGLRKEKVVFNLQAGLKNPYYGRAASLPAND